MVGGESRNDVRHDLLFRQAEFARAGAVDRDAQGWIIKILRNVHVLDASNIAYLAGDFLCQRVVGVDVISRDANIDRCRGAHVQNTVHKAAAGVKRLQLGQSPLPQPS